MDLTCFNWVQLVKKSELPSNAKYLALYLGTFMNAEHDIAWPSMARISHETGLTKNTARKWLDYLNDANWLVKRSQVRTVSTIGGSQKQNEYIIAIPDEIIRGVSDLPPITKGAQSLNEGGSNDEQRGINGCAKGGQQLPPNNNRITSNINLNNNAWQEYLEHRKALKVKPYTEKGEKMKTDWLAKQGDYKKQQAIVNQSIMNNWTGLFKLKEDNNGQTSGSRKLTAVERIREAGQREIERTESIPDITPHGQIVGEDG